MAEDKNLTCYLTTMRIAKQWLSSGLITVEDYKKIAKPTPEDQRKLMNGLVASAAQWSIQSISKQHPLLKYYIEAVLKRKELKDPIAMALAAKAIGMEVRINNK